MAGTTINIPLTTLTVGSHDIGPAAVADADTQITITIDRTVTNGLNSLTPATQITMTSFLSFDGGTTWIEMGAATTNGGTPAKGGTTSAIQVGLWPGTSRQVKANVIVTGTSVAVQGSVTTS